MLVVCLVGLFLNVSLLFYEMRSEAMTNITALPNSLHIATFLGPSFEKEINKVK